MKYGSLVFQKEHFVLIKYYQEMNKTLENYAHKNTLDILAEHMSNALIFDADTIPSDEVQLYSEIVVTCSSGWQETFELVSPEEENIKKQKVSVMSTLGASVIGLSKGDRFQYGLPADRLSLKIDKVLQPNVKQEFSISEKLFKKYLPKDVNKFFTLNI